MAQAAAASEVSDLVDELCKAIPEFEALWRENDVNIHGEGLKRMQHPQLGTVEMEYSAFAVHGRPDLGLIVHNPVDRLVADGIRGLVAKRSHTEQGLPEQAA